jgi:predicted CXXCH cytochrome family protein
MEAGNMVTVMKHLLLLFVLALAMIYLAPITQAAGPGFSMGGPEGKNGTCLDCHGTKDKVGNKFFIDPVKYRHTNHAKIGCPACHDGAVAAGHPAIKQPSTKTDCRFCHTDVAAEYAQSSHAGNASCHGCHDPHQAKTPAEISGSDINKMCAGCHEHFVIMASHAKWLPQAELHIEMLPCITCHTGSKNYVVDLYIINRQGIPHGGKFEPAGYDELKRRAGGKEIVALIDTNGDNYISLVELRSFNVNPAYKGLHLQGMMTPEKVTHSFQILDNRRDCTFCHASGPGAMQTSYIAVPEENGTFRKVAVEKGAVLEALQSTPDFYMTGKTRNSILNKVGLIILLGGLVMPVGHGFFRFLSRNIRNRKDNGHE